MKLYVCYTTRGGAHHPCGLAHDALQKAGYRDVEVEHALGWGALPGALNLTPGRRALRRRTGDHHVPALLLDDGTVVQGSREIVVWAENHPAA